MDNSVPAWVLVLTTAFAAAGPVAVGTVAQVWANRAAREERQDRYETERCLRSENEQLERLSALRLLQIELLLNLAMFKGESPKLFYDGEPSGPPLRNVTQDSFRAALPYLASLPTEIRNPLIIAYADIAAYIASRDKLNSLPDSVQAETTLPFYNTQLEHVVKACDAFAEFMDNYEQPAN